jgi:Na+-transporting NADH:ubiquinone oxidoreductase subunit NqrB
VNVRVLIIFSLLFFLFGVSYFNKDIFNPTIVISSCLVALLTQMLFALAYRAPLNSVFSALITSLLLILIIRSDYNFIYCLATLFAIASKFLIRIENRQYINPTVFGIMSVYFFMGNSLFTIPQIPFYLIVSFLCINLLILGFYKVLKMHTFLTYIVLITTYFLIFKSGEDYKIQNIIILSSFFLLDRSSLPNSNFSKIIMGILIFFTQIFLNHYVQMELSLILSVFIVSILSPIFNIILRSPSFYWNGTNIRVLNEG